MFRVSNLLYLVQKTILNKHAVRLSSTLSQVEYRRLDANIGHYYVPSVNVRPLALLFGWMLSQQKHLEKYSNFYINRGFDVFTIQVKPLQILLPRKTQNVIQNLLNQLEDESHSSKDIIIHGFSVGGYVYSELLVKVNDEEFRCPEIKERIVGQIFDSPVDMDGIPRGFSNIIVKNRTLQSIMKRSLELYLHSFDNQITKHYRNGSKAFKSNDLKTPSLMLYSLSDPVGRADRIEEIISDWKKDGIKVYSKSWSDSDHVEHFRKHPDEYLDTLSSFLENCNISKSEKVDFCEIQNVIVPT